MKDFYSAYKDVWLFHKEFIDRISDTDEFWKAVLDEGNRIAKKYDECEFVCNLIINEIEEFERIAKRSN